MTHVRLFVLQAGLAVGDMILSVNNEDLVGANYDTVNGERERGGEEGG